MSGAPVPGRGWRMLAPGALLRLWAARRRAAGRYDRATLAALAAAARRGGAAALCQWLLFRRDLGRPLPRRWVVPLQAALPRLGAHWRRRALGLIAEVAPQRLGPDDWAPLPGLGEVEQSAQRQAFAAWLAQRRADGVCVVGNAAGLAGQGLGPQIDAQGVVWRFNRWPRDRVADIGGRCDVWAVSPDLDVPLPPALPAWVLLSGPDPRWQLGRWPLGERLAAAGVPVVCVPLPVWRRLVARLGAPPSAGLLSLAWLQALAGHEAPWQGFSAPGIGSGHSADGRYHLGDARAAPGRRHQWAREAALVAEWRSQGLAEAPLTPAGRRPR